MVALATAALTATTLSVMPAGEAMSVQNTFPKPPGIERLDPALDKLIAPDATIEVPAGVIQGSADAIKGTAGIALFPLFVGIALLLRLKLVADRSGA